MDTTIRTVAIHLDFFWVGRIEHVHDRISDLSRHLHQEGATEISVSTDDVTEDLQ